MMNGINVESAEFEDAKLWSHSLDSEEWSHLQKSAQNVNQLLEKVEENVVKNFDEMHQRITGIGKLLLFIVYCVLGTSKRRLLK